jgi:methylated-DNA-[protein]-cysteine S-methyltransferase
MPSDRAAAATVELLARLIIQAPEPIGGVLIQASARGVRRIGFVDDAADESDLAAANSKLRDAQRHAAAAAEQLVAYFAGRLRQFELPLDAQGTPFQRRVWAELLRIPFGTTASYRQLAAAVGNANASRAVGLANGANRLAVVIPCHRIIGSDGSLTGYAGGMERKAWLLGLEGSAAGLFVATSDR